MELKLIEQSLGASEKCHHSFVKECWGQGPLIPLHFGKVGSNGKKKYLFLPRQRIICADRSWAGVHCTGKDKGTRE